MGPRQGVSAALHRGRLLGSGAGGRLGLPGDIGVFGRVAPEPDIPNFEAAIAAARAHKPDLIVGFGGGSAMDIAKLVAALLDGGQTLAEVVGPEKVAGRRVALAQVPTTAGTGSEVGTRALVTDPASRNKWAVQSRFMLADLAIVDPEMTATVPARITAETGVDAMAHCVEAFTNIKAHPIIDGYALEGVRLVGKYLRRAVENGADHEARAGMALASLYGGLCLGPVNTAGGHAIAYPLGTRHHIPHGAANAVIFPHVLAYNAPVVPDKTKLVLEALGLPASTEPAEVSVWQATGARASASRCACQRAACRRAISMRWRMRPSRSSGSSTTIRVN